MGRIIVEQIISADGFAEDADGGMKFVSPGEADEPDTEQLKMIQSVEAILLGRKTYEMFAEYWPAVDPADDAVAGPINSLPKHVVTNTLSEAPWGEHAPADIETGDGVEIARALQKRYSGDIIVWGSLTLADALLQAGAVDLFRLRIMPSLVGGGRGTTPQTLPLTGLRLTGHHVYKDGKVTLQYELQS
jgi:dihydrofolate reductase